MIEEYQVDIAGIPVTIPDLDREAMQDARRRQASLTKPPGSLGRLEEISVRLCGIKGCMPEELGDKVVILCAADHGVVEEGVSAYPQEVTSQMLANFAGGGAAINVLARHVGASVVMVDMGTVDGGNLPDIVDRRIRAGTASIARGPAMTREEAERSVATGIELARREVSRGVGMIATGDMGIGNTTPSSALVAVFTGLPVEAVVGRGTGLDDKALDAKARVVKKALAVNQPSPDDPMDALAKVGGLEIGALSGVILGGAMQRVPVVVDGFISGAAALLAERFCPGTNDFMFASHLSEEPGHRVALDALGLEPFITLNMRLGEGTGAVLAMPVIDAALKLLNEMATFDEAGVSRESG
jgi:nicotinate-nucleotide--dimethylbenzimidazole phosphoribosyltransferase